MNSIFGGSPPVPQGMFGGGQAQGMMGDPRMMQFIRNLLIANNNSPFMGGFGPGIEGEGLSHDPYAKTRPEQWNAVEGSVPMTLDENVLRGMMPQRRLPTTMDGLPPDLLRAILGPRQI